MRERERRAAATIKQTTSNQTSTNELSTTSFSHTFGMAGKCGPIFNEGEDEEDEEVDSPVIIFEIY